MSLQISFDLHIRPMELIVLQFIENEGLDPERAKLDMHRSKGIVCFMLSIIAKILASRQHTLK